MMLYHLSNVQRKARGGAEAYILSSGAINTFTQSAYSHLTHTQAPFYRGG